jgi:hypothetical protein
MMKNDRDENGIQNQQLDNLLQPIELPKFQLLFYCEEQQEHFE